MLHNKKIFTKISSIRWLIIVAITLILFLQIFSLYSVYTNISNILKINISRAFTEAMKEYRNIEFNKLNKPLEFKVENENSLIKKEQKLDYDYSNTGLNIDELMTKIIGIVIDDSNTTINLNKIDSLFSANLKKNNIKIPYQLTAISIENDSILSQTKNTAKVKLNYQTPKIEFDINREVQASYGGLYKVIFGKIIWYLIASAIIIIFISILLVYQLKIILRQKKIERIRQDFVDSMTHELKNPLQGALSLTEILQHSSFSNNPELRNNAITKIENNLQQINTAIEAMLEKAHSEDVKYLPKLNPANIECVINDIIANLSIANSDKNLQFSTEFNLTNPTYLFDTLHFPNAIKNIIENAIKYSKKEIRIDIRVFEENNFLNIAIQDNGIGIKKGNLPMIFNKFYRVEQKGYGFGLGLSYVKWVCNAHNGDVFVESTYGKGSTFTIQIPVLR